MHTYGKKFSTDNHSIHTSLNFMEQRKKKKVKISDIILDWTQMQIYIFHVIDAFILLLFVIVIFFFIHYCIYTFHHVFRIDSLISIGCELISCLLFTALNWFFRGAFYIPCYERIVCFLLLVL